MIGRFGYRVGVGRLRIRSRGILRNFVGYLKVYHWRAFKVLKGSFALTSIFIKKLAGHLNLATGLPLVLLTLLKKVFPWILSDRSFRTSHRFRVATPYETPEPGVPFPVPVAVPSQSSQRRLACAELYGSNTCRRQERLESSTFHRDLKFTESDFIR